MSLRARLALVLAGIMIGPLAAAGIAVGVLVPRANANAADASLSRSADTVAAIVAERCSSLDASAELAAGDVTRFTQRLPQNSAVLLSTAGARPVVVAAGGTWAAQLAAGQLESVVQAPCRLRRLGLGAALLTSAPGPTAGQRLIAIQPLDDETLRGLHDSLALPGELLLVIRAVNGPPTITASTLTLGRLSSQPIDGVLSAVGVGSGAGEADGWRYRAATGAGSPASLVVVSRVSGVGLPGLLVALVIGALLLLIVVLTVLTGRVTRPLVELTGTARRLGGGDLGARSGIRGTDEVATLATALDAMADDLQAKVEELQANRDALAHTFEHFGEALGLTHDLDGLLRTVVAATMRGADAAVGIAMLGDTRGLKERVSTVSADAGAALRGSAGDAVSALTDLAEDAVHKGGLVVTDLVSSAGPALAVPLLHEQRVVGALGVARDAGGRQFEPIAIQAVRSLAAHAGTAVANVRAHEETRRQSVTDPLTGSGNVRQLTITLAREVERASRFNRPLSILMLDLDHFKSVNDSLGHAFGNAVLREFARRLQGCLREVDTVARCGGEEFAVVLPETSSDGAVAVAARIVQAIRTVPFQAGGKSREVTVSVGVASYPDHGRTSTEVVKAADTALYAAKHEGRDRWRLAGEPPSEEPAVAVAHTG